MINNRYKINKKLGQGRSTVYLCTDVEYADSQIAIKILSPNASGEEINTFNQEFFILRKLNHPSIIKANELGSVVKVDKEDSEISIGSRFLTMEFSEGKELLHYKDLNNETNLKEIIKQLCSVLYYLHQSNYIYYDLKLENILVSSIKGRPVIKLIDFGFAKFIPDTNANEIRGTAEYIAPELLRKEKHDHRVDLYSLGILLYRIVYKKFPFETKNEIDIYKSHLESELKFGKSKYSSELIDLIKKLVNKEPDKRYTNAIQVLSAINIPIDESITQDWIPASVFSNRKDILTIIKTYLTDEKSGEVFVIKGSEGAGKTTLLDEIYLNNQNTVLISEDKSKTGMGFIRIFLKRIYYNSSVYPNLNGDERVRIEKFLSSPPENLQDEFKSIINKIASESKFILLLDGFNFYDEFTIEILKNILPLLQVNKIKIILSENTDHPVKSKIVNNLREISLSPFTDDQLNEFLNRSFYYLFPSEEFKKLILSYADLLPGNIIGFIKDTILLKILRFETDSIKIRSDEKADVLLKSSHEEIYAMRLNSLSDEEIETAELISAFSISIDVKSLSVMLSKKVDEVYTILLDLQTKNIIQQMALNSNPVFTTDGIKKFIYSKIQNKNVYHSGIVKLLNEKLPDFNQVELSRQNELAEDYRESYLILKSEIEKAGKVSAFSYQQKILEHLLNIPIEDEVKAELKFILCQTLFKLSDYKNTLQLIDELVKIITDREKILELEVIKGSCLIRLGDYDEGKKLLNMIIPRIKDKYSRLKLLVEISNAEFEQNKYDEATSLCNTIIDSEFSTGAEKGKCYNFLGLINIYRDNDLNSALGNFEKAVNEYRDSEIHLGVAKMEMNIGNIYNIKGEPKQAENYWNKSLEMNQSIGNIEQEAKLLLNFGVFHFGNLNFEKSEAFYQRASSIFLSLGNKAGNGLVQTNLGEIYFITCEYQKAITSLSEAKRIFETIQNFNECLEAFFILCKVYYTVGDYNTFDRLLGEYKEMSSRETVIKKYKDHLEFLKVVNLQDEIGLRNSIDTLKGIRKGYLERDESYNYFFTEILILKILIQLNEFKEALKELKSKEFVNLCKENAYFRAEQNYMLGVIASMDKNSELKSSIEYFISAYEIIKELNITEITWRILYMVTVNYAERGNIARAGDFIVYAKSVIDFIADKLTDPRLKLVYLDQPERHTAINTLNRISEQL